MTNEILAKALANAKRSAEYFKWVKAEAEGSEMRNIYWTNTMEYDGKAEAYLDCYKMLTGRKVLPYITAIEHEIEYVSGNVK